MIPIRMMVMDIYEVYVFCDECNDSHDMNICISWDDGPVEKESIGNLYAGKELPPGICRLINHYAWCPNTRRMFTQTDNNQIFLVPVGD
jgi:hypothetical protein